MVFSKEDKVVMKVSRKRWCSAEVYQWVYERRKVSIIFE